MSDATNIYFFGLGCLGQFGGCAAWFGVMGKAIQQRRLCTGCFFYAESYSSIGSLRLSVMAIFFGSAHNRNLSRSFFPPFFIHFCALQDTRVVLHVDRARGGSL